MRISDWSSDVCSSDLVSPPRSGSTLLYLLAVQKYRLSYFSNFAMACPASPALLTLLGAPFGACAGGASLDNSFGETPGWNGPNQGYRAWNRWFPTDRDFVPPGELSARARHALRRPIGLLETAEIGRASCRGRVCPYVSIVGVDVSKKHKKITT